MMNKGLRSLLIVLATLFGWQILAETTETKTTATTAVQDFDVQKISETFGHLIGDNLETPGFKFELDSIVKGMRDAIEGKPSPMTQEEYEEAITSIQEQAFNTLSKTNLSEANNFLESNLSKTDVVEIEEGKLQYKVVQAGDGEEVFEHSAPLIHYTGKFLNGTIFGSSLESGGAPITLPLTQTIPGFNKGLLGMKEGEKRTLFVHPDLGYGTTGHLPPNSLLIFDIEIVKANNDAVDTEVAADIDEVKEEVDLS